MKTVRLAIVLSILIHLLVIVMTMSIKWQTQPSREVEITFEQPQEQVTVAAPAPQTRVESEPEEPVEQTLPEKPPAEIRSPEAPSEDVIVQEPVSDPADTFDAQNFFTQSPFQSFKKPLDEMQVDTTDTLPETVMTAPPFFAPLDSQQFKVQPGPFDKIQDDINQRNTGTRAPLPLNQALREGAKYLSDVLSKDKDEKPVRLDFIPSESELAVLKVLWEQPKVTDHDIYTSIDTSVKITAEGLNRVLQGLTAKGLLDRQIVSPRNEFTLPLGTVEMSAKNRRNRVYKYQTRVKSDDVLRYLNAVLYRVEQGTAKEDSSRQEMAESIRKKILILLE